MSAQRVQDYILPLRLASPEAVVVAWSELRDVVASGLGIHVEVKQLPDRRVIEITTIEDPSLKDSGTFPTFGLGDPAG